MNINRNFFSKLKSQGIRLLEKITFSEKETLTERLININPTSNQKIERSLSLKEKHLWSTENPVFLYFEFELKRYDVLLDKFSIRRAIKVPEINKERLFLNSEQMTVKGINYHANFIENTDKIVSDLKMIKKMGFNAVRFPNLIPSDNYFSVADTLGLLIFCDFPIKRYPSDLFDDALLQISRRSASMAISSLVQHPSFFAFGLAQEVNLNDPLVQKFFIILNRSIKNNHFLTYLSTLPLPFKSTEIAADFYIIDHYNSSPEYFEQIAQLGIPYVLDGRSGIATERTSGTVPQANFLHTILDLKELLKLQGGFIESFQDWNVKFKSLNTELYKNEFKVKSGLVDSTGVPLP